MGFFDFLTEEIAIDLETNDPHLKELGSGNVTGKGHIAGVAVAVEGWSGYYPIGHEGGGNMDKKLVLEWVQEMVNQEIMNIIEKNSQLDPSIDCNKFVLLLIP